MAWGPRVLECQALERAKLRRADQLRLVNSRAGMGRAARCVLKLTGPVRVRMWLRPMPWSILAIPGGTRLMTDEVPRQGSDAKQSRARQTAMSLSCGPYKWSVVEGFTAMREQLVCEERLRPEAPGTEPCFRGFLGE